jgi:hypothetical protein
MDNDPDTALGEGPADDTVDLALLPKSRLVFFSLSKRSLLRVVATLAQGKRMNQAIRIVDR